MTSLKAASDMAQAMVDLRDTAAFQAKAVEFQRTISDALGRAIVAQQERATLLETAAPNHRIGYALTATRMPRNRYFSPRSDFRVGHTTSFASLQD
jgi:hypothetical protein